VGFGIKPEIIHSLSAIGLELFFSILSWGGVKES
jgi:hypothetical protein